MTVSQGQTSLLILELKAIITRIDLKSEGHVLSKLLLSI